MLFALRFEAYEKASCGLVGQHPINASSAPRFALPIFQLPARSVFFNFLRRRAVAHQRKGAGQVAAVCRFRPGNKKAPPSRGCGSQVCGVRRGHKKPNARAKFCRCVPCQSGNKICAGVPRFLSRRDANRSGNPNRAGRAPFCRDVKPTRCATGTALALPLAWCARLARRKLKKTCRQLGERRGGTSMPMKRLGGTCCPTKPQAAFTTLRAAERKTKRRRRSGAAGASPPQLKKEKEKKEEKMPRSLWHKKIYATFWVA